MQLLMAWSYFSSALIKLRVAGLKYLSPDNLPASPSFTRSITCDTHFRLAFWLPQVEDLAAVRSRVSAHLGVGVSVGCLLATGALVDSGLRNCLSLSTLFLMNIFLPTISRCI